MQCDFCSEPNPAWKYPAMSFVDFEMCGIASESVGDWAACDACHELIESGDMDGLANRSIALMVCSAPPELTEAAPQLRAMLIELHRKFSDARVGPVEPIIEVER